VGDGREKGGRYTSESRHQSCSGLLADSAEERRFDLRLQCERTLQEQTRPDISISVERQSGTLYGSEIFLCLEFKAPGVYQFATLVDLSENDDWVTDSKIYVVTNGIRHILIQDDTCLIYLHFENPDDIAAIVAYAVAAAGTAGLQCSMSQRELFLYAFADGLKHRSGTLCRATFGG
jgi:hypothetical protein